VLFLYFMVGAALAIPEVTMVMQFPKLYELMKHNAIFEVCFSLGLGVLVGLAMGIQGGVTFAVGNVFGTMITKTIYSLRIIEHCRAIKAGLHRRRIQIGEMVDTLSDLVRTIKNILGFPRKVIRDAVIGLNTLCRLFQRHAR